MKWRPKIIQRINGIRTHLVFEKLNKIYKPLAKQKKKEERRRPELIK
jgi:hypothetical protein